MKFNVPTKQSIIGSIDLQKHMNKYLQDNYNNSQNYEEIDYNVDDFANEYNQYYIPSFYSNSPDFNRDVALKNADEKIKKLLGYNEILIKAKKDQFSKEPYKNLDTFEIEQLENTILRINGNLAIYQNGIVKNDTYGEFRNMLTDDIQSMGELGSFIPQGVCNVQGYTLVSCYQNGGKPSILIMDKLGNRKWVSLDLKNGTHVGGIAYDPINNNIWVTGSSGEICLYNYDSIINNNKDMISPIQTFDANVTNSEHKKVASYMTYHDGKIYVGSFNESSSGVIKEYKIGSDGKTLEYLKEFEVPSQTQGISFIKKNGKEYMSVACSYGRGNDSHLKIFEYRNNGYKEIKDITLPPMLEQVTFNDNGTLKCVFESNAQEYNNAPIKIPSVCSLDISNFIK